MTGIDILLLTSGFTLMIAFMNKGNDARFQGYCALSLFWFVISFLV